MPTIKPTFAKMTTLQLQPDYSRSGTTRRTEF
jgi:hypothetical protein